jgi:hypothetical protein
MSREKQIEEMARELNTATFGVNVHTLADHLKPETINKVAEYLYNAGYRKQEWISVEERLPKSPSEILVSCCDGVRMMLYEGNNRWWYDPNYIGTAEEYKITHWMPLPEAPKMKGGAE